MTQIYIDLNDGYRMPQLGFGVFKVPQDQAAAVVEKAIKTGYRAIDTAAIYNNEQGTGAGLAASRIARDDLFVTTKLWNDSHAPAKARAAIEASLERLGLAYADLYLIHWPAPGQGDLAAAWKSLVAFQKEGLTRSIGVSNFTAGNIERIIDATGIVPCVNQIELHPEFQHKELRAFHARHGIATESWSPLGQGAALKNPVVCAIAKKRGKTPAQVILRWHLDQGLIVIPKSVSPQRIAENFAVFDFELGTDDHAAMAKLDNKNGRIGPDPATFG